MLKSAVCLFSRFRPVKLVTGRFAATLTHLSHDHHVIITALPYAVLCYGKQMGKAASTFVQLVLAIEHARRATKTKTTRIFREGKTLMSAKKETRLKPSHRLERARWGARNDKTRQKVKQHHLRQKNKIK